MFNKFTFPGLIALLMFSSCSKKDDLPVPNQEIFMDFTLDGTSYKVSNKEYILNRLGGSTTCLFIDPYVEGYEALFLENPKEAGFIESVGFYISKKVSKEDLDLSDESDYMEKVLNADQYGFPINPRGFYSVYDPENNHFEISENVSAEAYLWISTNDDEFYRSTSMEPKDRDPGSNLIIDKVTKVKDHHLYQYIVEGRFRVNLFDGLYGTDSKIAEGSFRWPAVEIRNSELIELCK